MKQVYKIQGNASALVDYNHSGLNIKIENFLVFTRLFSIKYVMFKRQTRKPAPFKQ